MNLEDRRTGLRALLLSVLQVALVGAVLSAGALLGLVMPRGKTDGVASGGRSLKTGCWTRPRRAGCPALPDNTAA